jgi:2-oxoglutarate dehydrogenase E2 component (dihydrolipoamide succinyltransferase)
MSALLDIVVPDELEGGRSVVRAWLKQAGDTVRADEPLLEIETDKVSMEVPAPAAGVIRELLAQAGASVEPGQLLGRMSRHDAAASDPAGPAEGPVTDPQAGPPGAAPPAAAPPPERSIASFDPALRLSPSVRRALIERDLDPAELTGTGRGGRLTRADVDAAAAGPQRRTAAPAAEAPAHPAFATGAPRGAAVIPHDRMRLAIAEHMSRSLAEAPHVTAVFEADFSAVAAHRRAHKAEFERQGVGLTYSAYLLLAAARAMDAAPAVNGRWHEDRLEVFHDINIGVGTSLGEKGLIVPVVRRVQALSLLEAAQALGELTERARTGRLTPRDTQGGTFSISNHGVSGSLLAAPIIINQPQSAILGVGKLEKRVVVREVDGVDTIQIRPMAYVSLSIDHRALDGHQTNAWLTRFVQVLETWPA